MEVSPSDPILLMELNLGRWMGGNLVDGLDLGSSPWGLSVVVSESCSLGLLAGSGGFR